MAMRNLVIIYAYFILILITGLWNPLHAQDCNLTGRVIDSISNEPIPYVNIVVLAENDSSVMLGAITDDDGAFKVKHIDEGVYNIKTSFIGYQSVNDKFHIKNKLNDLGEIKLSILPMNLEGVTIKATKSSFRYDVDKKVIDAGSFPGADVAMDLLENIPSLQVDFEGKLTYRGDGKFQVFINGHPVSNGEEKLNHLSAERIDKIEVITNPSAKYDADGTAGIIHIILKKNKLEGYAISSSVKMVSNGGYDWLFSIDKKGELGGWYLEGQYSKRIWTDYDFNEKQSISNDGFLYETNLVNSQKGGGKDNLLEFGVNYDLTKKDYIDFSLYLYPFNSTNFNRSNGRTTEQVYSLNSLDEEYSYDIFSNEDLNYRYLGSTFSFEHAFNKKRTHLLSAYIDYSTYLNKLEEKQKDTKIYEGYSETLGFYGTEQNEKIIEGRISYAAPLNEKNILEAGISINTDHIPKVTSVSGIFDSLDNITPFANNPDNQSVDFVQDVYSGYLTFKSKWERIDYQIGGRIEYTERKSDYTYYNGINTKVVEPSQNYFIDFFPSFHFTYSFTEDHQLIANYSHRIQRPDYWSLIPLKQYSDPFLYYVGNGNLLPAYSDAYEIGYKKSWNKDFIAIELFGRKNINVIQDIARTDTLNILVYSPQNVGRSISIGTEIMTGVDLFSWWNTNFSSSFYNYQLDISNIAKKETQFRTDSRFNNSFTLMKSLSLKWDFHYNSPMIAAQKRRDGYFYSNLAVKKGFKEDKWRLILACSNIFSSIKYRTISEGNNFYKESRTISKPYFSVKISYMFDNQE